MMQSPRKWDLGLSVHNIANAVYDVHGPICTIIASHPGIALPKVIYGGGSCRILNTRMKRSGECAWNNTVRTVC